MANEQLITIRGRLTNDPELRFTPSGAAVANFTIATNARTFDKQTNEWKEKETIFWRCSAWREMAENAVESLQKGTAVIALAELEARSFESNGEKRTATEAKIEAIGPDLRWASAKVTRTQRNNSGGGFGGNTNTGWGSQHHDNQQSAGNLYPERGQQQAPADDPWAAPVDSSAPPF